jgi:hypothetical protein
MALITTSDLYYDDYSWSTYSNDDPKITGEPDSTLLNRKEGYEILYFINEFSKIHELKVKSLATKIEKMIRNEVPANLHSQENIKEWIEINWSKSKY